MRFFESWNGDFGKSRRKRGSFENWSEDVGKIRWERVFFEIENETWFKKKWKDATLKAGTETLFTAGGKRQFLESWNGDFIQSRRERCCFLRLEWRLCSKQRG
jgi:hypothetical protein